MTRAELYASAKKNGALLDLSHRAKWLVSGADRIRFLNGQVSNDVRKLKPNEATIHACVLTAKGKLCGDVFISVATDFPDNLRIDAESSLRESLAARLERYIIADDVTIEDWTDSYSLFHIVYAPDSVSEQYAKADAFVRSQRFGVTGYDVFIDNIIASEFRAAMRGTFVEIDEALAETFRIEAGIPKWGAELNENTLPDEAGLERDAIDFHKGCYVGQEVISRIKSVGHVNRSLRGFVSDSPLAAGMKIFAPNEGGGKPVGHFTSAAWSFGLEKWAALGYLKRGFDSPALEARTDDGSAAKVELKNLPLIS